VGGTCFNASAKDPIQWKSNCTNDEMAKMHARYREQFHSHHPNRTITKNITTQPTIPYMIYDRSDSSTVTSMSTLDLSPDRKTCTFLENDFSSHGVSSDCFFFDLE